MRTVLPILAVAALLTVAVPSSAGRPGFRPPAQAAAANPIRDPDRSNAFDFAMYGALKSEKGNLFFSGPSMREALGIAYLGARANTATEMSKALRLDSDQGKSADYAKTEIADFNAAKGSASLTVANRLWADKSYQPKAPFAQLAMQGYGSPVDPLDFRNSSDASRITINDWVAKNTNDKIKDLLPAGSIKPKTRMVITNAVWFKGNWEHAFQNGGTHDADFFVDGANATKTPMMHQTSYFGMAKADGATMLEMKYEKSDLAMDVILPDAKNGLAAVEDKVVANGIGAWTSALVTGKTDVAFPKLTLTWGKSLKEPLVRMGMPSAFDDDKADFSGIADAAATNGPLVISDVLHKAFVAIDEKGTEAAASTGVVMVHVTSIEMTPTFVADQPFIFVIRDTKQNRVLFTGRVTNPKG